jgi:hypothetical protein
MSLSRVLRYLLVGCLLVGAASGVFAATGGDAPVASAGLDQTVQQNATVYLDAGGSYAESGEIVSYSWEIESPDGSIAHPDCPTCERTSFEASETGEYSVRLTVEDSAGRTASDTLYVAVVDAAAPAVSLAGPNHAAVGENATVDMTARANGTELSSVVWLVDGKQHAASFLDGGNATESLTVPTAEAGTYTVDVVVTDANGTAAGARHEVTVHENSQFDVSIDSLPAQYEAGESITPTVTVANTGPIADTQEIRLSGFGGNVVDSEWVTLDPGERATLNGGFGTPTLDWKPSVSSPERSGSVTVRSATDSDAAATRVTADPASFAVEITDTSDGSDLEVSATVTNEGDLADDQRIVLASEADSNEDSESVSLDSAESETVTLAVSGWESYDQPQEITVASEDDEDSKEVGEASTSTSSSSGLPYQHFSVSASLPSEITVDESTWFSASFVVWPNNYDGMPTERYSPGGYRSEYGASLVWQNQYAYNSPGYAWVSTFGTGGQISGREAGTVQICFADSNTGMSGPGGSWGSCHSLEVVEDKKEPEEPEL